MTDLRKTCKEYYFACDKLFEHNDSCDICKLTKDQKAIDTEMYDKINVAAHMDAKAYLSVICSLPQIIEARREVAQMILRTTDRLQLKTLHEQFEYMNDQIKKVIGI